MKKSLLSLSALTAVMSLILSACEKKAETAAKPASSESKESAPTKEAAPANETPAAPKADPQKAVLAAFETEFNAMSDFMKESKENMSAAVLQEMGKRAAAMKTDGLPEDLKTPFEALRAGTAKMIETVKDLPTEKMKDPAQMQAWVQEQMAADPEFMTKFQEKMKSMAELGKSMDAVKEPLKAAGAKYGLKLRFDDDDKEEAPAPAAPSAADPAAPAVATPAAPAEETPAAPAPGDTPAPK